MRDTRTAIRMTDDENRMCKILAVGKKTSVADYIRSIIRINYYMAVEINPKYAGLSPMDVLTKMDKLQAKQDALKATLTEGAAHD